MDIYCPKCAEPCDLDELHYAEGMTFDEARKAFFTQGCSALFGGHCEPVDNLTTQASGILAELLGDDVDGIASMMDDFSYMGMLDD